MVILRTLGSGMDVGHADIGPSDLLVQEYPYRIEAHHAARSVAIHVNLNDLGGRLHGFSEMRYAARDTPTAHR